MHSVSEIARRIHAELEVVDRFRLVLVNLRVCLSFDYLL